jgi:hypothetical protein
MSKQELTAFDKVAAAFKQAREPFGCGTGKPTGEAGSREWSFHQGAADRDLMSDPQSILDEIEEMTGVDGKILLFNEEAAEQVHDYKIIVGNLHGADGECWAISIESSMPDIEEFDSTADVRLIESPAVAKALIKQQTRGAIEQCASDLIERINLLTSEQPAKLLALLEAIEQHPQGQSIIGVWKAEITSQVLGATTSPAAQGKTPGARM